MSDVARRAAWWLLVMAGASLPASAAAQADEPAWPREILVPEARIIVYQPQIEEFQGDRLTARTAVAVAPAGTEQPIFGAVWFAARIRTDRDARMVTLVSLDVSDIKFPRARKENLEKLVTLLKSELSMRAQPISLDRVVAALDAAESEEAVLAELRNDPPRILFVAHPAVLVTVEGKPELRAVENSKLQRVVNTPFLMLHDPATGDWYLRGGHDWFKASGMPGPWRYDPQPPAAVTALVAKEPSTQPPRDRRSMAAARPEIRVATEPTELITSDGEPKFAPVQGTGLLYMSNTESDVFVDTASDRRFVLLAGRWYAAPGLNGPWSYVAPDKLPADFAKIPEASEKADVLAHVAGTQRALDAIHEAHIPQTAAIDRKKTTVQVEYDGEPQFKPIQGTAMEYAVNTPNDVIHVGSQYFCCHEGVWFVARSPTGPWTVCDSVPQVIYTIPLQCPIHPVTYVHVYESTPQVVYVGYTPGYLGCYPYFGTVVYGTGYVYSGWYGAVYYPRPPTFGFSVRYNSVTGAWGFRAGYSGPNGWVAYGYRNGVFYDGYWAAGGWHGNSGWWGHGGYHDIDVHGDVNFNRVNVGSRVDIGDHRNIYNRRDNLDRLQNRTGDGNRPSVRPGTADRPIEAARAAGLKNDVFTDRDGNIFRHTDQGWQQRVGDRWSKPDFATLDRKPSQSAAPIRPASPFSPAPSRVGDQRSPQRTATPNTERPSPGYSGRPATRQVDLNRHHEARQKGDHRSGDFRNYSSGGSRGGRNLRGGGGRGGRR